MAASGLKFGYLLQNLPANVFFELLEWNIVENKKTKLSHAKQIFFIFFRDNNEYIRILTNVTKCF